MDQPYKVLQRTVAAGIATLTLGATVGYFISNEPPGIFVAGVLFVAGAAAYALWWALSDWVVKFFRPVELLGSRQAISTTFSDMVEHATSVTYVGAMDVNKAAIFLSAAEKARVNRQPIEVKVFNTDPRFYGQQNAEILEKLVRFDRDDINFKHEFCFQRQDYDLLFVKDRHGKPRALMVFGDHNHSPTSHALLIHEPSWLPAPVCEAWATLPINLVQQAHNVVRILESTKAFFEPLRRGWFQPVFPPIDKSRVREEWRKAILDWFNSTVVHLCANAGANADVKITWRIEKQSLQDALSFKLWLDMLREVEKIKVTRYMLIDFESYAADQEYREVVDTICSTYLPTRNEERYSVSYIDSNSLDPTLKRDFALITIGDTVYAQDSLTESASGTPGILMVFFSQGRDIVWSYGQKFQALAANSHYSSLTQLNYGARGH